MDPSEMGAIKALVFLPIVKMDAKTRTIVARITDETVDASKEICDYETTKPYFEKWSANAEKATAGKSKGNLRAMHQPISAGKLTDIIFDDTDKAIDCVAKVVDDAEWEKCEEGVYTGLSLGGNYVGKKWKDTETGAWRYTVDPIEVSLVDLPCNPSATFKYAGVDGAEVTKTFKPWEPSTTDVAREAEALFKARGLTEGDFMDLLADARESLIAKRGGEAVAVEGEEPPAPAPETEVAADKVAAPTEDPPAPAPVDWGIDQVFRVKADGSVYDKKADAKSHVERLQAVEQVGGQDLLQAALAKAKKGLAPEAEAPAAGEPVMATGLEQAVAALKLLAPHVQGNPVAVVKGLYTAGRSLELLGAICGLVCDAAWEAGYEKDGSTVPAQLADAARALAAATLAMAQEEIAEALAALPELEEIAMADADGAVIELARAGIDAVKANTALCTKAGARNSTADLKRIQGIHDASKELGAGCEAEKTATAEEVAKITAERDTYKGQIDQALPGIAELGDQVSKLAGDLTAAKAKISELEKTPAPMPTIRTDDQVVTRAAGIENLSPGQIEAALIDLAAKQGPDFLAKLAMKGAQAQPVALKG